MDSIELAQLTQPRTTVTMKGQGPYLQFQCLSCTKLLWMSHIGSTAKLTLGKIRKSVKEVALKKRQQHSYNSQLQQAKRINKQLPVHVSCERARVSIDVWGGGRGI
ncbi:hypothetical protein J6590_001347 [Homalodisca vitripennis]|nr:hypothetical protein J6590_001347 [Homalodisca vitripennis]